MLIVNPPFRASDENVHYLKALSLSEGHLTSTVIHDKKDSGKVTGVGSYANWSYVLFSSDVKFAPFDKKMTGKDIVDALSIPPDPAGAKRVFDDYGNSGMAIHSPLLYLPQATGMLVGRAFSLSPLLLMYMGRFFNLLFFLILVYVSISIMPVLKWAIVFLVLMPQTIFLAASLSADGPLLAYCFLAVAYFFALALDPKKASIGRREIVLLLLLAALLGLVKPPYFLLVLLFLMIPLAKLRSRRDYLLVFALILVLAIVVCGGWTLVVKDASRVPSPTVKPGEQLHEIITHPLRLPHVIYSGLFPAGRPTNLQMPSVQQFVGTVGWNGPVLPIWFGFWYLFALFFVSAIDKEEARVRLKQKTVALGTAILTWIVVLAIF